MLNFLVCVESINSPRPQPQAEVQVASQLCCELPAPNSIGKPRDFGDLHFETAISSFRKGKIPLTVSHDFVTVQVIGIV